MTPDWQYHLEGMMGADGVLYEKILDTPSFSYHFNQLCLLAKNFQGIIREAEQEAADRATKNLSAWRSQQDVMAERNRIVKVLEEMMQIADEHQVLDTHRGTLEEAIRRIQDSPEGK
jgi:hypothetical protein